MGFKDLFKSKAEQKAYAQGRRDQYNKEHPKLKWGLESTRFYFNKDGTIFSKSTSVLPSDKYTSRSAALEGLNKRNKEMKLQKQRVLEAVKRKNVNEFNSYDCSYTDYKLVKINERKK